MAEERKNVETEFAFNQELERLDQNETLDLLARVIKSQAARHLQTPAIFVEALRTRVVQHDHPTDGTTRLRPGQQIGVGSQSATHTKDGWG